ncbi:MAG: AraC family transcriptional regulator [Balneolia bacterium]|nr:AraC family transcriptional regulator [Balneolia bacterium]
MPSMLPFPSKPQQLVENRRIFGGNDIEFSIYDTYQTAERVELQSPNPLYCGMITGRKTIHMHEGKPFDFLPNESLVIPSGRKIHIDFPDAKMKQPTQCITIEICKDKVSQIVDRLNEQFPRMDKAENWEYSDRNHVHFENTARFNQNLDQIINCFTDQQPYRDVLIDLNTSRLIIHMLQSEARKVLLSDEVEKSGSVMAQIVRHIRSNIRRRISISELEKIACVSRATLFRRFQNEMGCSPVEFVNRERMKEAAKALRNGLNVTEACYEFGYQSVAHFIDVFRKHYGTTPNRYRMKHVDKAAS